MSFGILRHISLQRTKQFCQQIEFIYYIFIIIYQSSRGNKAELKVGDEKVDEVVHLRYLGSVKTVDGNSTKDVKIRIGMAKAKTNELGNIWKERSIQTVSKVKLVKTLIWPVLMYGCEGWVSKKEKEKRIYRCSREMWIYRRILRIS